MTEWDKVRQRGDQEITPDTKFMDVVLQIIGGLNAESAEVCHIELDGGLNAHGEADDVHFIIQEWINIVYPFLKEKGLREAVMKAQKLTTSVINNPMHIQKIWSSIGGGRDGLGTTNGAPS